MMRPRLAGPYQLAMIATTAGQPVDWNAPPIIYKSSAPKKFGQILFFFIFYLYVHSKLVSLHNHTWLWQTCKAKSYGRSSWKSPFDTKTDKLSLFSISRSFLKRIPQSSEQTCVCVWLFWPPTILGILFHFSLWWSREVLVNLDGNEEPEIVDLQEIGKAKSNRGSARQKHPWLQK